MGLIGKNAKEMEYNMVLSALRKKMIEADKNFDSKTRNVIASQVNHICIPFSTLLKIDTVNTIFFLNYNEKMAITGLRERSAEDKAKLFKKIEKINLSLSEDKQELVDFLSWACSLYDDEVMSRVVKHLCDNLTIEDTQKLFELTSIVNTTYLEKCKKMLNDARKNLKTKKVSNLSV